MRHLSFALLSLTLLVTTDCSNSYAPLPIVTSDGGGSDGAQLDNVSNDTNGGDSNEDFPLLDAHADVVLAHPKIVSLVYQNDTRGTSLFTFADYIEGADWLKTVGADYGVGSGVDGGKITLAENAPNMITDAQIIARINEVMTSGQVAAPTVTPSSLMFLFYTPSTTRVAGVGGAIACETYAAYHGSAEINHVDYTYAVIPACSNDLDDITYAASHELIEAATDGYENDQAGYYLDLDLPSLWYLEPIEVADMCEDEYGSRAGIYSVTRVWSTSAARQGTYPCIPWPAGTPYYNVHVAPDAAQTVAPGGSATFTLTGFAINGYGKSWGLDLDHAGAPGDFVPTAALSRTRMAVGDTVTLTVTAPSTASAGDVGGLRVYSDDLRYWPVVITVR